jgi:cytochrome P450
VGDPLVVDLSDPELWQDPYPTWREARRRDRLARTTKGEPILLSADDADLVASDPAFAQLGVDALRRLGITDGPLYQWRGLTLAANDGPVHERLRSTVGRAFTPRRVEVLRNELAARARGILDAASDAGSFDVVADYANDLPLWLLCRFMGIPLGDYADLATFLVGTEEGFAEPMTPERRARAEAGIVALYAYVDHLVADRRAHAREDLVSDLVEAQRDGHLSPDELSALVVNVIGGAVGSTRAAIANSVHLLLSHRDHARWVADDPARVRVAVEECLRFAPPFRAGRRKAIAATTALGIALEPGDTVYLARQAVNRDPSRWEDPDRFDVARAERRHYSFGYGTHFCLGQALARLDVQVAVAAILERLDDLTLLAEVPRRVPFTADEQIEALPVAVSRR